MRYLFFAVALIILIVIVFFSIGTIRETRKAIFVTQSKAIAGDIYEGYKKYYLNHNAVEIDPKRLVAAIETADKGLLIHDKKGHILDPWKNPLRIHVWVEENQLKTRVESNGRDGKKGTPHDIEKTISYNIANLSS